MMLLVGSFVLGSGLAIAQTHEGHKEDHGAGNAEVKSIKGEIVDLMCYIDHEGKGEKHAKCAATCVESGGPVGILAADGKVYLVIGEHKPMNKELAPYAGKTITLKGKLVERGGMRMLANAEISK